MNFHFDATADATATQVGTGRKRLRSIHAIELDGAPAYVQFFDSASGGVTLGTTTPDLVVPIPPSGVVNLIWGDLGETFVTGLTYAVTTTATGAVSPTTAVPITLGVGG